ncbi:MAG: energy-coupled thiamine transporter ThiT [Ruminococcus sp.]|jgi:thiamine transporter|nr:energy-coupled thiamine transporter ThiT [Ruminococcus sp.]
MGITSNTQVKTTTQAITLGAVMLALAFGLSFVKVYQLPYGGSITLLSMLPILIYGLIVGVRWSFAVSFLYGAMQFFVGGESPLAWGLNAGTLVVCILADYIFAFGVLGITGFFRKSSYIKQLLGVAFAIFLRFVCHFISGVTIWKNFEQFDFFGNDVVNPYLYSIVYNGSYMLPEMVFTVLAVGVFLKIPVHAKA